MTGADDKIAVLRVELEGIEPLIWRRVGVRAAIGLMDVHAVIQAAMGWDDSHLWHFEADGGRYFPSEPEWNERYKDAETAMLGMLIEAGVRRMSYVYDMGDVWEHAVIVERMTVPLPNITYPQFLGGERRCPPEDCGGVPGYNDFLSNIASKEVARRNSALDWYGGPYDPDDIDEQRVITALRRIARAAPAAEALCR